MNYRISNSQYGLIISDGSTVRIDSRSTLMSDGRIWRSEDRGWSICRPDEVWSVAQEFLDNELLSNVRRWIRRISRLSPQEQSIVLMALSRAMTGLECEVPIRYDVWQLIDARLEWGDWQTVHYLCDCESMTPEELERISLHSAGYVLAELLDKVAQLTEIADELLTK